jgi:hypothetical protein
MGNWEHKHNENKSYIYIEKWGDNHLLEIRLLETGFLSRFENKMLRFWRLAKEKKFSKEKEIFRLG